MNLEDQIAEAVDRKVAARLTRIEKMLAEVGADELLTIGQAAKVAKVKPSTIRSWVRKGYLVARGKARGLRVSRKELIALRREDIPSRESADEAAARMLGRVG